MPLHNVLVYGTLKTGHVNHSILTESEGTARLLGLAHTVDSFPLIVGSALNIPFLLHDRGVGLQVEGELYEVDEAKLARLDQLEKHPHFYERTLEKVRILHSNETVDAWAYMIPKWADDLRARSSSPIAVYQQHDQAHGRPLLNNRDPVSITHEERLQVYREVLGALPEGLLSLIPQRVFVYGTLKKGEPNHSVLAESEGSYRSRGTARSVRSFPLAVGTQFNIPFVLAQPGHGELIHGEIYEVDPRKLQVLDALEAHPVLYERTIEKFTMDDSGVTTTAWIYMIHRWKDDFLSTCSERLNCYSSNGSHGRPYVDRYVREKLMRNEETNLFKEIMGFDPRDEQCQIGVGERPP